MSPDSGLPRPRSSACRKTPTEDRFAVARIRFGLPPGTPYYRVSQDFPNLVGEVRTAYSLPGGLDRIEVEVVGSPPPMFLEALRREPGVESVSTLTSVGPIIRYRMIAETPTFRHLQKVLGVLIRYPMIIQNGAFTIEVAGRATELEKMVASLRKSYPSLEILRFGRDRMRTVPDTLTPGQDSLLHQALAAGYFEVPRRITLTQLAQRLGKSKSALSRRLAEVERKLAEAVERIPR